jgi:hypothetical protein
MFLLDWYEQLLMIRENYTKPRICESCETLRSQLATVNHEKQLLLSRVMDRPEKEIERTVAPPMQHLKPPIHTPWRVKQQMLEANDREKARALRNAPKPDIVELKEMEEFEKEVADAERARETNTGGAS